MCSELVLTRELTQSTSPTTLALWHWQVNAAYKKALLRFHPDRASALAQGDPRQQVQAEETFKLISRLKNTLSLVASPLFNPFR